MKIREIGLIGDRKDLAHPALHKELDYKNKRWRNWAEFRNRAGCHNWNVYNRKQVGHLEVAFAFFIAKSEDENSG